MTKHLDVSDRNFQKRPRFAKIIFFLGDLASSQVTFFIKIKGGLV